MIRVRLEGNCRGKGIGIVGDEELILNSEVGYIIRGRDCLNHVCFG